ncbi:hypothetical protein LEM8419_00820 [Neolewinella maritima]|uniref:O-antigen ligase domain-containing protein n=1 Tax=Neolewinella maritima TaxID=1383882 RepID=A0ABN8F424_9BACT|nr:hypothetical protein [Neolewinella maritima]CAH0999520.1 hypothetical protein LEM8419_00820 [Neolewinella maritima]
MTRALTLLYLIAATAFSLKLFDARFIPSQVVNYINYVLLAVGFVIGFPQLIAARGGFAPVVRIIVIAIVCSIPMACLVWGQGLSASIFETLPFLAWIYFFVLIRLNVPIATLERVVIGFGLLYLLLYIFQYVMAPTVYFGRSLWGDTFSVDRGVIRIVFPGAGVFVLTALLAINKLTTRARGRLFWMVLAGTGLLVPILQVTRQFIAGMVLLYLYHILRNQHLLLRVGTLASAALLVIGLANANITQIDGLVEAGQRDADLGEDYIRVKAGEYFVTDFSPEWPARIFGNGVARWGEGAYGQFVENLGVRKGYFLSDVGIIAVYANFGLLALLGFALMWYRSFRVPLPANYHYLKYYLWYLLLTSMTWFSVYHHHYVIATVYVLYIYHRVQLRTIRIAKGGHSRQYYLPEEGAQTFAPLPAIGSS